MCLTKSPTIVMPEPTSEAPKQEAKQPGTAAATATASSRKNMTAGGATSGTLLTSPTGIEQSQLNLGKTSLLGQ
jgi:hypothetical protein